MARFIELRRHTDNDGDRLTEDGIAAALQIGAGLTGPYEVAVSSGAQRATQTLGCFLAVLTSPAKGGVVVEPLLRSEREDQWKELVISTGSGAVEDLLLADADFVEAEADRIASGLRAILATLGHGEMALAVGHSPTNEAGVYGLTRATIGPMAKGTGVLLVESARGVHVEPIS